MRRKHRTKVYMVVHVLAIVWRKIFPREERSKNCGSRHARTLLP